MKTLVVPTLCALALVTALARADQPPAALDALPETTKDAVATPLPKPRSDGSIVLVPRGKPAPEVEVEVPARKPASEGAAAKPPAELIGDRHPAFERDRLRALERAQSEFSVALAAQQQDDPATAAKAYERALKIDPEFVEAQVNLARLRGEQGRKEEARDLLARAAAARPDYPQIYAVRGWIAARSGDPSHARADLERAIHLDPTEVDARVNLAAVLMDHGSATAAIQQLETALTLEPENADATLNLGLAHDRLGDAARARHFYQLFLARSAVRDAARNDVSLRLGELAGREGVPSDSSAASLR